MDQFISTLSAPCASRFKHMLKGEGGDIHTFATSDVDTSSDSCSNLNGVLCETQANILQAKKKPLNCATCWCASITPTSQPKDQTHPQPCRRLQSSRPRSRSSGSRGAVTTSRRCWAAA